MLRRLKWTALFLWCLYMFNDEARGYNCLWYRLVSGEVYDAPSMLPQYCPIVSFQQIRESWQCILGLLQWHGVMSEATEGRCYSFRLSLDLAKRVIVICDSDRLASSTAAGPGV